MNISKSFTDRFKVGNKSDREDLIKSFFTANSKFESKSIQKNFRFIVSFDNDFDTELIDNNIKLFPYHILSIDMPTSYGFKFEPMKIGPYSYSFPTMDHNGFDITVVFEEDDTCSIAKLIHYLQYKIIGDKDSKANGNYNPQSQNRIKTMFINIYDDGGNIVRTVRYYDLFFTGATSTALNYEANESIKYTITFHCDFMQQDFIEFKKD